MTDPRAHLLLPALLLLGVCAWGCGPHHPERAEIRQSDLTFYVRTLSDDNLRGRESGTVYARRAADFLVERYEGGGLAPAFTDDDGQPSFYQSFDFTAGVAVGEENRVELTTPDGARKIEYDEVQPLPIVQQGKAEAEAIFAGFCLQAPDWNDLKGLEVKGRIVVCLRHGPGGPKNEKYRSAISFRAKFAALKKLGAAGIIFLGHPGFDPLEPGDFRTDFARGPIAVFVEPEKFYESFDFLKDAEHRMRKGEVVELSAQQRKMGRAVVQSDWGSKKSTGYNVGAYARERKENDRIIVIGAHFDHLGLGEFSSLRGRGKIHNGADDNASGTAAVLEVAMAFSKQDRSDGAELPTLPDGVNVLFLHFDAEERGLFGSRHFVRSKAFAEANTVAMINLDMVGRLRKEKGLMVQGAQSADARWEKLIREAFAAVDFPEGLELRTVKGGSGPSDHTPFYTRKIPVAFVFTGGHRNYHTPDDDFETINLEGLVHVTQFNLKLVEGLAVLHDPAGGETRLSYRRAPSEPQRSAFEFRVRLGIMPGNYESNAGGLEVGSVNEKAPVKQTGLQSGDIIVQLGEEKINDINDYMSFLSDASADRAYKIIFKRGDRLIEGETKLIPGD